MISIPKKKKKANTKDSSGGFLKVYSVKEFKESDRQLV